MKPFACLFKPRPWARILLLSLAACGNTNHDPLMTRGGIRSQPQAVVGGSISDAFAATGALRAKTQSGTSLCTATLVAPTMILTAAHCVDDIDPQQTRFILGMDITQPTLERRLTAATMHPDYAVTDDGAYYDVAVAWLDSAIREVTPVHVSFIDAQRLLGENAVLVGYGANGVDGPGVLPDTVGSGVRRGAHVQIDGLALTHWQSRYDATQAVVCRGDSGGPAFAQVNGLLQQVGVTSLGDTRCEVLGLYSRLDLVADWLEAQGLRETAGYSDCSDDGYCNGACQADLDCASYLCPRGTCTPSVNGCVPAAVTYSDNACHYVDQDGRTCAATDLVEVEYDPNTDLCTYRDPLGVSCVQTKPRCTAAGTDCVCPS